MTHAHLHIMPPPASADAWLARVGGISP